jgi:intracellular sulfur oxidation DsrE/DsrF family protein
MRRLGRSIAINRWRRVVWLAMPLFALALVVPFIATLALTGADTAAKPIKSHRVVFQINTSDPETMRHVIANALNLAQAYGEVDQPSSIEIVAYGPGVHMFRTDTSPVLELLRLLRANVRGVVFTVCGNTRRIMEQNEGHPLSLVDGVQVVPSGVVRLVELQEAGWSYLRP